MGVNSIVNHTRVEREMNELVILRNNVGKKSNRKLFKIKHLNLIMSNISFQWIPRYRYPMWQLKIISQSLINRILTKGSYKRYDDKDHPRCCYPPHVDRDTEAVCSRETSLNTANVIWQDTPVKKEGGVHSLTARSDIKDLSPRREGRGQEGRWGGPSLILDGNFFLKLHVESLNFRHAASFKKRGGAGLSKKSWQAKQEANMP